MLERNLLSLFMVKIFLILDIKKNIFLLLINLLFRGLFKVYLKKNLY
jgi:hypothetical protein